MEPAPWKFQVWRTSYLSHRTRKSVVCCSRACCSNKRQDSRPSSERNISLLSTKFAADSLTTQSSNSLNLSLPSTTLRAAPHISETVGQSAATDLEESPKTGTMSTSTTADSHNTSSMSSTANDSLQNAKDTAVNSKVLHPVQNTLSRILSLTSTQHSHVELGALYTCNKQRAIDSAAAYNAVANHPLTQNVKNTVANGMMSPLSKSCR